MVSTILLTMLGYTIVILIGIGFLAGNIYLVWSGIKESDNLDWLSLFGIILGSLDIMLCAIIFLKAIGV